MRFMALESEKKKERKKKKKKKKKKKYTFPEDASLRTNMI